MLYDDDVGKRFFFLSSGIYIKTRRLMEKQLKPLNITWPQIGTMMVLSQNGNITQKQLAEMLDTDATSIMVVCDSLEKKKLLNRKHDHSDRRVNRLVLTEKGKEVFMQAYQIIQINYNKVLKNVTENELKKSVSVMGKIYHIIKEMERI